jgi:type IV pilus assembly protein PilM
LSKGLAEKITDIFKPQAPLWACELTPKHIIVAGLNHARNSIRAKMASALPPDTIVSAYAEPNIRNAAITRSMTKQLLAEAGFSGSEIAVVVPDNTVRIAFVNADNRSKNSEERETFLRWKLKKTVPFDVDSAQIAYRVFGPQRGTTAVDILVALSPRSIVEEYETLFDELDIHAGMVLPSTLAALNLLSAPAGDSLVLKAAPDCITTTIFKDGRIQFYRRIADASSIYDAVYPTVMYYQDKLEGTGLRNLYVCGYDQDLRKSMSEVQEKLGLAPQPIEPTTIDDIFKPVLGSVHLAWQNLI